jgi:hypothetical protein
MSLNIDGIDYYTAEEARQKVGYTHVTNIIYYGKKINVGRKILNKWLYTIEEIEQIKMIGVNNPRRPKERTKS